MAGKGGGAWKVAYADFVTAMMAFFLVMWIVAQSKPVKEAIAGYFRDPSGYASRPGKPSAIKSKKDASGTSPLDKGPFNAARSRPPSLPGGEPADTIEERTAARTNRITLGNDDNINVGTQVLFADDSAVLDDRGKRVLDQLTPELLGKICKIEIRGHASGRRLPADSTFSDAWQLSYARSVAAMDYLLANGVDPRRIRLSQGGIHEPNLLVDGVGRSAQNARVEVYVLNEVVSAPSETEKKRGTPKKFAPRLPARPKAGETHE